MWAPRWVCRILLILGDRGFDGVHDHRPPFNSLRLLLGVAEAAFLSVIILYLSQWVLEAQQARTLAGFMLAISVAPFWAVQCRRACCRSTACIECRDRAGCRGSYLWPDRSLGRPAAVAARPAGPGHAHLRLRLPLLDSSFNAMPWLSIRPRRTASPGFDQHRHRCDQFLGNIGGSLVPLVLGRLMLRAQGDSLELAYHTVMLLLRCPHQ